MKKLILCLSVMLFVGFAHSLNFYTSDRKALKKLCNDYKKYCKIYSENKDSLRLYIEFNIDALENKRIMKMKEYETEPFLSFIRFFENTFEDGLVPMKRFLNSLDFLSADSISTIYNLTKETLNSDESTPDEREFANSLEDGLSEKDFAKAIISYGISKWEGKVDSIISNTKQSKYCKIDKMNIGCIQLEQLLLEVDSLRKEKITIYGDFFIFQEDEWKYKYEFFPKSDKIKSKITEWNNCGISEDSKCKEVFENGKPLKKYTDGVLSHEYSNGKCTVYPYGLQKKVVMETEDEWSCWSRNYLWEGFRKR